MASEDTPRILTHAVLLDPHDETEDADLDGPELAEPMRLWRAFVACRSGDGEAMVFHDHEMPRLTGLPGLVSDYGAAQLSATPLVGGGGTVPA